MKSFKDAVAVILPEIDRVIAARGFAGVAFENQHPILTLGLLRQQHPETQSLFQAMVIQPMNRNLLTYRDELVRRAKRAG